MQQVSAIQTAVRSSTLASYTGSYYTDRHVTLLSGFVLKNVLADIPFKESKIESHAYLIVGVERLNMQSMLDLLCTQLMSSAKLITCWLLVVSLTINPVNKGNLITSYNLVKIIKSVFIAIKAYFVLINHNVRKCIVATAIK